MKQIQKMILVVDDTVNIRRSFCQTLELCGYRTREASSGEDALEKVEHEDVALVLMDVVMPGMGGIEAARKMRQRHSQRPIILMSAYADARIEQEGISRGSWTFLRKPIEEADLVKGVSLALKGNVLSGECGAAI